MQKIFRAYQLFNILSLDVAAGAMVCASFFAHLLAVKILPPGLICLGLTVWIIYTSDHLLDARKIHTTASTARHRFHQRHFKILFVIVIVAALFDGLQLLYIKKSVFTGGIVLALIVILYFFIQRKLGFLKELFGAVLYTGGVLLIPYSLTSGAIGTSQIILAVQFFLTALTNLLLFSWFDHTPDERDNHQSFTTVFGDTVTQGCLIGLFLTNLVISVVQVITFDVIDAVIVIVFMNVVLLTIFLNRKYFQGNDRYRLAGDAVFLFPLFYILMKL